MKKLTCEMCGGTDIVKMDGMFLCQTCGTKYSVEEAKKMMIEGTVDVSGSTVIVDNSSLIDNYLKIAESALESSNEEEAELYSNKILEIDPMNYKAWLIKGQAVGVRSSLLLPRLEEEVKCINKAIENCPENVKEQVIKEADNAIYSISLAYVNAACIDYVDYCSYDLDTYLKKVETLKRIVEDVKLYSISLLDKYGVQTKDLKDNIAKLISQHVEKFNNTYENLYDSHYYTSIDECIEFRKKYLAAIELLELAISFVENNKENIDRYAQIYYIIDGLVNTNLYYKNSNDVNVQVKFTKEHYLELINKENEYLRKIKEIDPTYDYFGEFDVIDPLSSYDDYTSSSPSSGCYIATAVYGSYDCPEVWTLRRFRDYCLAETWHGRRFIETYYLISPKLVKWFGSTEWFKKMWKNKLDKIVKNLHTKGYESTPYMDRKW